MSGNELKKTASDLIDEAIKEKIKEQIDKFGADLDASMRFKEGELILSVYGAYPNDPELEFDVVSKEFNLADVAREVIEFNEVIDESDNDWLEAYAEGFEKIADIFRQAMINPDPS